MGKRTIEDLQELVRIISEAEWQPMTEEEIVRFRIIPEKATKYTNLESFQVACEKLYKSRAACEVGSNPDEGLFWTFVK